MNRTADMVARLLVLVGALNWGLIAIAEYDLVAEIFGLNLGETNVATRIVYGLVGLSAIWLIATMGRGSMARDRDTYPREHFRRAA